MRIAFKSGFQTGVSSLIRAWMVAALCLLLMTVLAPLAFPWTFISGNVDFMYWVAMRIARIGLRFGGIRVRVRGLEYLSPNQSYIYMSNHVSNLDPPVIMSLLPRRTSVLVKRELFRIPILGRAMLKGSFVPIDRKKRESAISSVHAATRVLKSGVNLTIFPEGTRSPDGRLLPFKKIPFYLAMQTGVPIVPITIYGTEQMMPKSKFSITPGTATVIFHAPIHPEKFQDRSQLVDEVRAAIESGLPELQKTPCARPA